MSESDDVRPILRATAFTVAHFVLWAIALALLIPPVQSMPPLNVGIRVESAAASAILIFIAECVPLPTSRGARIGRAAFKVLLVMCFAFVLNIRFET
jgi:hypothetical protein